MHISFAVFADAANLSQEGKLNVLGIFDALHVGAFPTLHPRAHLVVRVKGSPDDIGAHTLSFQWISPGDRELWSSSGELQVERGTAGAPIEMDLPIIAVVDLPLDTPGQYTMQLALDGEPSTHVSLFVSGPAPAFGGRQSGLVS